MTDTYRELNVFTAALGSLLDTGVFMKNSTSGGIRSSGQSKIGDSDGGILRRVYFFAMENVA